MNSLKSILIISIAILSTACTPKTNVVLLDNGKVQNSVLISTDRGSRDLNKIGEFVSIYRESKTISPTKFMSENEIKNLYGTLFKALPKKAKSYILYFKKNSTELTKDSKIIFKKALKTIEERSPCVVDIIGHTDTVGSREVNQKVSKERAQYVKSMIVQTKIKYPKEKRDEKIKEVQTIALITKGYGEEDLLIKTADNVDEAKNRNVEIFIK